MLGFLILCLISILSRESSEDITAPDSMPSFLSSPLKAISSSKSLPKERSLTKTRIEDVP